MKLLEVIKSIFKFSKKSHNARDFVEILRTDDKEFAIATKVLLEKFKIPVYEIDHMKSNDSSSGKIILRVPRKYLAQANEILENRE